MELRKSAGGPSAADFGPYKATRLWNEVIEAFRQGVPRGKHRRYMRSADNCFLGSAAVDWLLEHLKKRKDFSSEVTRQQTAQLLNKFYKAGIFEEIQVSRRGRNRADFSDSNRLYRLLPASPSKGTRTPLAVRTTNNIPVPRHNSKKDEKPEKHEKPRQRNSTLEKSREKEEERAVLDLDAKSLPQCHLVGRFLSGAEINEVWKTAVLSRLKKVLGVGSLEDILQDYSVDGGCVRHNCIFLNKSGIVTNIQPEDQLPHWVLSAMRCLARWPEKAEGDLPSYPGFEKDVFGVVRDYFIGLPEPLITYELYDVIINAFVQACNQLPRHSSPFSHARDRSGLCQSLWSDSSLENIILNLTRKYCMADSKTDLYSLADSRPDLFTTSDAFSEYFSHSNLHSTTAGCYGNLTNSHRDLGTSRNVTCSHRDLSTNRNLADSHRDLSTNRNLADSHRDLSVSGKNLADSQVDLAADCESEAHRNRAVYRMAHSQGDLQHAAPSYSCTLPSPHSRSHADLRGQCHRQGSRNDVHGMNGSVGNLHGGRSVSNLRGSTSVQNLAGKSLGKSHSALGCLSESSCLRDSKQFRSNPDLQVTRYETAFGPENQTVTRVYFHNGMATDFHHNSAQEQEGLFPMETHFDVAEDASTCRRQSTHISFERVSKSYLTSGSDPSTGVGRSRSFNSFQQQFSSDCGPSLHRSTSHNDQLMQNPLLEETESSLTRIREGKRPPPYHRSRGERYNTFCGTQLAQHQVKESRGLTDWERELSSSTPYLPGLRVECDDGKASTLERRPKLSSSRGSIVSSRSAARRPASLCMNLPQSGLHEERATKALQAVCLFLPPASRRKLHYLLKLMSKMAANPHLTFDPSQSTRSLVLGTFQAVVLQSREETELDSVLVFQLVSFLVDHHMDIMAVPADMKQSVEEKLRLLEKPQIVYSPRDPSTMRFCQPVSTQQFEASKASHSHKALVDLLDSILRDQNMADREKRRRLKQFQKTYPQIYRQRFPEGSSDPVHAEQRLRIKPPAFAKPLLKLRGLRV